MIFEPWAPNDKSMTTTLHIIDTYLGIGSYRSHLKALTYGKYEQRGLSCGSIFNRSHPDYQEEGASVWLRLPLWM